MIIIIKPQKKGLKNLDCSNITLDMFIAYLTELKQEGKGNYIVYFQDEMLDDSQVMWNDNKQKIIIKS